MSTTTPRAADGTTAVRVVAVVAHRRSERIGEALRTLVRVAGEEAVEVRLEPADARAHGVDEGPPVLAGAGDHGVGLCVALGGDGTVLQALRRFAGTGVPVFGVNFGELGFLASVEPDAAEPALREALRGRTPRLPLPVLEARLADGPTVAVNDVALHRRPGQRVPALGYAIDGTELGRVRCDGLVVATPAGSTGYNLANGGPVLAWGVAGYVVSFIAPHSLAARALVADPAAALEVRNESDAEVDLAVDGRPAGVLGAGATLTVDYRPERVLLAHPEGIDFYRRLGQKFGRLAG